MEQSTLDKALSVRFLSKARSKIALREVYVVRTERGSKCAGAGCTVFQQQCASIFVLDNSFPNRPSKFPVRGPYLCGFSFLVRLA